MEEFEIKKLKAFTELENLTEPGTIICIGPGGVGKTTIAAMLGLFSAGRGKKTLCATVDPALRLAETLGIKSKINCKDNNKNEMGKNISKIDISKKIHKISDKLDAILIGGKWVIDYSLNRYGTENKQGYKRYNAMYSYLRNTLQGLHELASFGVVNELKQQGTWDVIIVDTAPSKHGIDFIEMPARASSALKSPMFSILTGQPLLKFVSKDFLSGAANIIYKSMGKIVGLEFLVELGQFISSNLISMKNLSEAINRLQKEIENANARIVQITSPHFQAIHESLAMYERIKTKGLVTSAFIINKVLPVWKGDVKLAGEKNTGINELLKVKLEKNLMEMKKINEMESSRISILCNITKEVPIHLKIPLLNDDVHDMKQITRLLSSIEKIV